MSLDPLMARLILAILTIVLVLSVFEVVLALAAGNYGAASATSFSILVSVLGLVFVGSIIRKQSSEN